MRPQQGLWGYGIFAEKIIGTRDTEGKNYRNTGYLRKNMGIFNAELRDTRLHAQRDTGYPDTPSPPPPRNGASVIDRELREVIQPMEIWALLRIQIFEFLYKFACEIYFR